MWEWFRWAIQDCLFKVENWGYQEWRQSTSWSIALYFFLRAFTISVSQSRMGKCLVYEVKAKNNEKE